MAEIEHYAPDRNMARGSLRNGRIFLPANRRSLQLQRWEESLEAGGDADGAPLCILSRPDPGFPLCVLGKTC